MTTSGEACVRMVKLYVLEHVHANDARMTQGEALHQCLITLQFDIESSINWLID